MNNYIFNKIIDIFLTILIKIIFVFIFKLIINFIVILNSAFYKKIKTYFYHDPIKNKKSS
jgi:hypothetical protein